MATLSTDSLASPFALPSGVRLLTIADVAAMPTDLPSGPIDYELDNGRLVLMSPTGRRHGQIHSAIAAALYVQGQERGHGEAYVETGVVLWRNPDRMVGPDVSFVAKRSLPVRESTEEFLETIPDLVVEVRSKNDSQADLDAKVTDYRRAGVRRIWIIDPAAETVTEHCVDQAAAVLGPNDLLTCEDLIPGFSLSLADLFRS